MSYLGTARFEKILDREKFEKELTEHLHKVLHHLEAPPKEKHVRNVVIATWRENSANTVWRVAARFPLRQVSVVCWKACFVIHRVFRDGPKQALSSSNNKIAFLKDLWTHWGSSVDPYAKLVTTYLRVLITKITFHAKYQEIPPNVRFDDEAFKMSTNIDDTFQLAVEVFDLQSSLLHLFGGILTQLDPSKGIVAQQVQCRIHPLISCIEESSCLYDLAYKLMDTMHRSLPEETLEGHRDRFNRQYSALRKYFNETRKMRYFDGLVDIPQLRENPPNFLLPPDQRLQQQQASQPAETKPTTLTTSTSVQSTASSSGEGAEALFAPFDFSAAAKEPEPPKTDERTVLIEQLMREGVDLKERLSVLQTALHAKKSETEATQEKLREAQMELTEYKEIAEQACGENVLLKNQIEELQTQKGAQTAVEARASALDEKYSKLKSVYTKLREEHIELLRANGETKKQVVLLTESEKEAQEKMEQSDERVQQLSLKVDDVSLQLEEERREVALLQAQLDAVRNETAEYRVSNEKLKKTAEQEGKHLAQSSLVLLLEMAEKDIRTSLDHLLTGEDSGATCPPEYMVQCAQRAKERLELTTSAYAEYSKDQSKLGALLVAVPGVSHSLSDLLCNTKATRQLISEEGSQKMLDACRGVSDAALEMLRAMKADDPGAVDLAKHRSALDAALASLLDVSSSLVMQEEGEDLSNAVEDEMAATEQAVNDAVDRIQEMLKRTRETDKGQKLEVNSSILEACTTLMEAMQSLIKSAIALQNEIVAEGRGVSSVEDFYKKHHRWTEGLISAAKTVGNGATMVVNSADKVVNGKGKFEELIVYSKDIAASTAQLVAASRVKARPKSEKLTALKGASKKVTEATGGVVATAHSFLDRKKAEGFEYLQNLSLTQAKRQEMECQVRALELEKELETERNRLAELRKLHYHLAGSEEGWEVEDEGSDK